MSDFTPRLVKLPSVTWRESPNYRKPLWPPRNVDLLVAHDTEGTYAGSIGWLCNPASEASSHLVIREDGGAVTQLVPWSDTAWTCRHFNDVSDNFEMSGFLTKPLSYDSDLLNVAARIIAIRAKVRNIPIQRGKVRGTTVLKRGIVRHADLGYFGGGHNDPMGTLAFRKFLAMVKWHSQRITHADLNYGFYARP